MTDVRLPLASFELDFSYSQFMVWDTAVDLPGCAWTSKHSMQGFARRTSVVNFGTLCEYGLAHVRVFAASYVPGSYERVIAVPFLVQTGQITIEGPEERHRGAIRIGNGPYFLYAAQRRVSSTKAFPVEDIDLFFEKTSVREASTIVVRDSQLESTVEELVEDAAIAR